MEFNDFKIIKIDDRKIILRGLGKMFYQEGMPIGILAKEAADKGYEASWLHIADELQKHGWSVDTIVNKLKDETGDSGVQVNLDAIKNFLCCNYEDQREMIFQYLFGSDREKAKEWFIKSVLQ